ncbi:MAG: hypothetical protein V3S13_03405 [Candidatus Omnitrophota bacterium]
MASRSQKSAPKSLLSRIIDKAKEHHAGVVADQKAANEKMKKQKARIRAKNIAGKGRKDQ